MCKMNECERISSFWENLMSHIACWVLWTLRWIRFSELDCFWLHENKEGHKKFQLQISNYHKIKVLKNKTLSFAIILCKPLLYVSSNRKENLLYIDVCFGTHAQGGFNIVSLLMWSLGPSFFFLFLGEWSSGDPVTITNTTHFN